jgi:uncharacterized protein (UPF0276 family)
VAAASSYGRPAAAGAPIPAQAGVGLRFPHHAQVLAERPPIAWLEVHPENYLGCGAPVDALETLRRDYPLSFHATGLSLGSACGLNRRHLSDLAELAARLEPALISDHLSWSAAGGIHAPDLLPLPYTLEALDVMASNVAAAQDAFGRRLLIENPSAYLRFAESALTEGEFLGELVRRTGCGLLLDVNNLYVTARNLGEDPRTELAAMLAAVPAHAIGEIHLAGHAVRRLDDGAEVRIDDHGSPVGAPVWALFAELVATIGPRPTLIEWDTDIPPLGRLLAEAAIADAVLLGEVAPAHA